MILVKVYEYPGGKFVILCDKELIGKKIKEGDVEIEIGEFYKGEEIEITKDLFEDAASIHAVGPKSINVLEKLGIIDENDKKNIKYIGGIPFLFIFYV